MERTKISLYEPGAEQSGKYFSLRIKERLFNEPAEYTRPEKLLLISNVKGNFNALRGLLLKMHVINESYDWTFEDNHLIIIGNCIDIERDVTECLWFIYSLEERARRAGGYVHFILGEDEIMSLNGRWRYKHPKYAKKKATSKNPATALYEGNNELWRWLCTKNIVERIGDLLIVHAGMACDLAMLNLSVSEINNLVRPFYIYHNEIFTDPLLHIVFNSNNSPIWYSGYYDQSIKEDCIDLILSRYQSTIIITGHTVMDHVCSFFNGKIINVGTNHTLGNSEALLISKSKFYRVSNEGDKVRFK